MTTLCADVENLASARKDPRFKVYDIGGTYFKLTYSKQLCAVLWCFPPICFMLLQCHEYPRSVDDKRTRHF